MIAILPFKNLNANEDSAFLIDGIFEDILTELSMVRQVSIVSRQSSMNFTESGANLDQFHFSVWCKFSYPGINKICWASRSD